MRPLGAGAASFWVLFAAVGFAGCGPPPGREGGGSGTRAPVATARCAPAGPAAIEATRAAAEGSLAIVDYAATVTRDAPPRAIGRRLDVRGGRARAAVVSFPRAHGRIAGRSYVYDDALLLLWLAWTGDETRARAIAETLRSLQNADGSWGFSFSTTGDFYNADYVRAGTVAWAVHALAYFGRRYADADALATATRGARFLESLRVAGPSLRAGLLEAGRGRWSPDERVFDPSFRATTSVTEHQLDACMALATLRDPSAAACAARTREVLWIDGEGRFAVAAGGGGVDTSRALDAAGGWGALFLLACGAPDLAGRAFAYTRDAFAVEDDGVFGFQPYLDPVDGPLPVGRTPIFVEGSLGMALAAHRLGDDEMARRTLDAAAELSCRRGPGLVYSSSEARNFPVEVAAAPTLWFLFVERELRMGTRAPLFAAD
jgi:hypothetical protein